VWCQVWKGWEGEVKSGERVHEKVQEKYLGGRTMDYSIGEGGRVKKMRIGIRE
jgi:hypothetical protein